MNVLRDDEVTWREVDDEIVVLDLKTSRYLSLNGPGAILWKALADGGATAEELAELLLSSFEDVDGDTASADVQTFLAQCAEYNLLK